MPSPLNVLKAFDIHIGMEIAGYKLENTKVQHRIVIRNQEYTYPTVLTFTDVDGKGVKKLRTGFNTLVKNAKIAYSDYGNPYTVIFGKFNITNEDGKILISAEPYAIKNFS